MSNIYADYVRREADLTPHFDSMALDPNRGDVYYNGRIKGWDEYYDKHRTYLNGLWKALSPERKDKFIDIAKSNAFIDLNGGSSTDVNERAKRAAKRVMARDWHKGVRYFAGEGLFKDENVVGMEGGSGQQRGLHTYSVLNHDKVGNTPVKNVVVLTSNGQNYLNEGEQTKAYNTYGNSHWNNYGKNEARALPGAKFSVKNGKLSYESSLVGSGLKQNYDNIAKSFNDSEGGNYKALMEGALGSLYNTYQSDFTDGDFNTFSGYYLENKVPKKASSDYAQPPMGTFDSTYYAGTNRGQAALQRWNDAQQSVLGYLPDLDVVGGYGVENTENNIRLFLHGTYTDIKNSGIADKDNRGNKQEETTASDNYYENWNKLSDAEQQAFRDNLLGLTQGTASGGLTVDWDSPYVTTINEDGEEEIVYEIDADGNRVPVVNTDAVSFLESSVFNVFGQKDLEQQDRFQALALDVLKTAVDKLNAERKRESELNIYKGLPGFNEIYGANASIANSLIGDSGIGGYLSMAGVNVDRLTESFEDQLSGATGISNNSSVYNWQKWFDETMLERYQNIEEITGNMQASIEGLDPILDATKWASFQEKVNTLDPETQTEEWNALMDANNLARGLTKDRALEIKNPDNWKALLERYDLDTALNKEEAQAILEADESNIKRIYAIEDDFRDRFIDDYIKPRFDQSKSMDEFISYLDTLDEDEQNVFQTQDAMTALKNVASAHAAAKLSMIQATPDQTFDHTFYFDPTTAIDTREGFEGPRDDDYRKQAERVQANYATAISNPNAVIEGTKTEAYPNGITWNQYAYYYGVDLNNKEQFSRLHYDAIGKNLAYDPAKDITSVADIKGYIVDTVIPKVAEAKLDLGDASFSAFTTPEEFADHLLEGIDPTENNPEWKEILEEFGLDLETSLDELKEYIIDITRTGAAKEIRESIKYLNEKKLKPTQDRLGVTYIERDEDQKDIDPENQSSLYQIFANAGYAGTEDEFFTDFMPDADRGDIQMITQALPGGTGFNLSEISSDPFAAMSQIGSFMGTTDSDLFGGGDKEKEDKDDTENYFNLFDDKKEDYYSDAGRDYISEYTTFFK